MALVIPDLFTPYLNGRRQAIADNWQDLTNYNTVQRNQLSNLRNLGTLSADINRAYEFTDQTALQNLSNQYQLDMLARLYPYILSNNIRNLTMVPQLIPPANTGAGTGTGTGTGRTPPNTNNVLPLPGQSTVPNVTNTEQANTGLTPEEQLRRDLQARNLLPANGGMAMEMTPQFAGNFAQNGLQQLGPRGLEQFNNLPPLSNTVISSRSGITSYSPINSLDYTLMDPNRVPGISFDTINGLQPNHYFTAIDPNTGQYVGVYADAAGNKFFLVMDSTGIQGRIPISATGNS